MPVLSEFDSHKNKIISRQTSSWYHTHMDTYLQFTMLHFPSTLDLIQDQDLNLFFGKFYQKVVPNLKNIWKFLNEFEARD